MRPPSDGGLKTKQILSDLGKIMSSISFLQQLSRLPAVPVWNDWQVTDAKIRHMLLPDDFWTFCFKKSETTLPEDIRQSCRIIRLDTNFSIYNHNNDNMKIDDFKICSLKFLNPESIRRRSNNKIILKYIFRDKDKW